MSEKQSQEQRILAYLKKGFKLTSLQALDMFDCMRLAPRIHNLKKAGHRIQSRMKHKNGKYFSEYWL